MLDRRFLSIDPLRCNGCKECEKVCSMKHMGKKKCPGSRIEVLGGGAGGAGVYLPVACQQCINPPCLTACPKKAIRRDVDLERVVINETLCVGCRMCVSACPSGAMGFDADAGLAYKCDLCEGDPQCVRACKQGAITFPSGFDQNYPRMAGSALNLLKTMKCGVASGMRRK